MGEICCSEVEHDQRVESVMVRPIKADEEHAGNDQPVESVAMVRPTIADDEHAGNDQPVEVNTGVAELVITFKCPDGGELDVTFTRRPLDIDFGKKVPITVKNVQADSIGAVSGVVVGCTITKINGVDMTTGKFEDIFGVLSAGGKKLPNPDGKKSSTVSSKNGSSRK